MKVYCRGEDEANCVKRGEKNLNENYYDNNACCATARAGRNERVVLKERVIERERERKTER